MDYSRNTPALQALIEPFNTLEKAQLFCRAHSLNLKNAPLLYDLAVNTAKRERLLISAFGDDYLNYKFLKWANVYYTEQEAKWVKFTYNEKTHLSDGWKCGKGLSIREVIEAIKTGDNFFIQKTTGKKQPLYHLAQMQLLF